MSRIALVGYGRIAPKHLEVLRALDAEIVACCNRSPEGRSRAEKEGGINRTYSNLDEMVDREQPDGIVCTASMDQVYRCGLELIPRCIPLLLEKPPGTSLAEFNELCALSKQYASPVMVGLNRRHYSLVSQALADCGGPSAVTSVFVDWSENPQHILARGFSPAQVKKIVFGNSLHGIDLLTHLAGAFPEPKVIGKSFGEPARWVMGFQGISTRGVVGSFTSTWDSPGGWRVEMMSTGRRYTFVPLETCRVTYTGSKEVRELEPSAEDRQFKSGFYGQTVSFLQMVRDRQRAPAHDLESVRPAMELAEQLTRACD